MAYPESPSSGKIASATPSSCSSRTWAMTASALRSGSATVTGSVQAATRAKPWA